MIFATFQEAFGQQVLTIMVMIGLGSYFVKKFLNDNPNVKSVAKDAVNNKAISWIKRLLK